MTEPTTSNVHPFDRRLLARMTGALGDSQTIGKICGDLGQIFSEFLPDILKSETGLDIAIAYAGFEVGLKSKLITELGTAVALSDASLRNWAADFTLSCDSPLIITLIETLLGAPPSAIEEPKQGRSRPSNSMQQR